MNSVPRLSSRVHRVALCTAMMWAVTASAASSAAAPPSSDEANPAARDACAAPMELGRLAATLPRTRAVLAEGAPLVIVAIGSSSTAGAGASSDRQNYPSRLAVELARRKPASTVHVDNRGANGEDAAEMLTRFDRDVLASDPDLVVWQMGTNAILRHVDLDAFEAHVQAGIDRVRAAGIDLILMDLQYAPRVVEVAGHLRMLERLEAIGQRNGVPVFHRYAVMKYWAQMLRADYVTMLSSDGLHMNDASYVCLAARLADAIVEAGTAGGSSANGNAARPLAASAAK